MILENLAQGTSDEVMNRLKGFIDNVHGGTIGAGGFLGLIMTSMSMLISIENAFNRIWRVQNTRSWFQRITSYWFFITLGPLALSVGLGVATSSNLPISRFFPTGSGSFAVTALFLTLVYNLVPNTKVRWKFALISGFWTAALWHLTRVGYGFYVNRFAAYNRIYGSLAAIPIILFWIYLVWLLVLSGAALTAAMQRRLERPATEKRESRPPAQNSV